MVSNRPGGGPGCSDSSPRITPEAATAHLEALDRISAVGAACCAITTGMWDADPALVGALAELLGRAERWLHAAEVGAR